MVSALECCAVQYKALSVPYPKDKDNVKAKVDAEEKLAASISVTLAPYLFYSLFRP